ncbi:NAD(P)-dependent oxidoreductase [Acidobacteria bacterium AH-259-O06]|nr:NAD(P)-dependent oxidoreductase [Acidobacteria bacterium AH-259-O06]
MANILVTGASGFIGKRLIPRLSADGHEIFQANRESGDVSEKSTWLKFPRAEVVIHLAGKTFVPESWTEPAAFIKCNLLGTVAALDYCKKHNARLVFMSSYLYGNPVTLPIPETAPVVASNPYALSKKLAEEACQFYSDSFGMNITILRPFNVYGADQPENFLIPSIIRQVNAGKVIYVKDLEPKRDYVYISDLIEAITRAIELRQGINIFNIGSGVSYSVEEIIRIIQCVKGKNLPVHSVAERRKEEIMNTVADITAAKLALSWAPRFTLLEGLQQMFTKDN